MNSLAIFSDFIRRIRSFLEKRGYIEVFTDYLRPYPNVDMHILPFECNFCKKERYFLHTSPEYEMKKLISRYKLNIYQICKVFRNCEPTQSPLHKHEFLMLEYYRLNKDYTYLMEEVELLLKFLFGEELFYQGRKIPIKVEKISLQEAFKKYLNINFTRNIQEFKKELEKANIYFEENDDWETLFNRAYIQLERYLGMNQPTIIYSFPEEFSGLAKCKEGWCERFELYIFGIEIANAYTELTDPVLLEQRLKTYAKKMKELYSIELPIDHEFIEIHKDLPHLFTGISIGLERLFMLAINAKSLKVLF